MMKSLGPVYRLDNFNEKKKTYLLVPRFGQRFANMFPEKLYAKQADIDPILEEGGYMIEEVPVSEPLLLEILEVDQDRITKLRRFETY